MNSTVLVDLLLETMSPEQRREYMKKWRAANPERFREISRKGVQKWRTANPEKYRERIKNWKLNHPEAHKKACKKWDNANPEAVYRNYLKRYPGKGISIPAMNQKQLKAWRVVLDAKVSDYLKNGLEAPEIAFEMRYPVRIINLSVARINAAKQQAPATPQGSAYPSNWGPDESQVTRARQIIEGIDSSGPQVGG